MVMVASKDGSRAERSNCQIKFDESIFGPSLAKELLENRLSFLFFSISMLDAKNRNAFLQDDFSVITFFRQRKIEVEYRET